MEVECSYQVVEEKSVALKQISGVGDETRSVLVEMEAVGLQTLLRALVLLTLNI